MAAGEVAEEAWYGVEGSGSGAPVASSYLFPVEGVVVVVCGWVFCPCSSNAMSLCCLWRWGSKCWWAVIPRRQKVESTVVSLLDECRVNVSCLCGGAVNLLWLLLRSGDRGAGIPGWVVVGFCVEVGLQG